MVGARCFSYNERDERLDFVIAFQLNVVLEVVVVVVVAVAVAEAVAALQDQYLRMIKWEKVT